MEPSSSGPAHRRRVLARRKRRVAAGVTLAFPALALMSCDMLRRGGRLVTATDSLHQLGYAATFLVSVAFWGLLLFSASRRRGVVAPAAATLFVGLYTVIAGTQGGFYARWGAYLAHDTMIFSSIRKATLGAMPLTHGPLPIHLAVAFALAGIAVLGSRRFVRPGRVGRFAPILILPAACAVSQIPVSYRVVQSSMPDVIYAHGIGTLVAKGRNPKGPQWANVLQTRYPDPVPPLTARPARPRNVLFVLQETLRADVTCTAYDPACPRATRFSNASAPARLPFLEMRANGSSTMVSLMVLLSSLSPVADHDSLHRAPLLWDYAHAAGYDAAYWTSQNLMVANFRHFVETTGLSHFVDAMRLDPLSDFDAGARDALLTDHVIREWGELKEPFLAIAHFSNPHYPGVIDRADAPYDSREKVAQSSPAYHDYYLNAVHLSDRAVARLIDHVRSTESGKRTVIVFTADHGEAMAGEREQIGHTTGIFEEQIRVPAWIDAPPSTLAPDEEKSLAGAREQRVFHTDLASTLLDLLGVWDDPAFAPFRAKMPGRPLTRPERATGPVVVTNCTWIWECRFPNWGLMLGSLKLESHRPSLAYQCFDVAADPGEQHDLGAAACGPLPELAKTIFPRPQLGGRHTMPSPAAASLMTPPP